MVEENEFELPVPVSKLSYDSIMLGFAIEAGCEALLPRTAFWRALVFVVGSGGAKMELPLFGTQLQNQSLCGACRRSLPLNVATVAPNRHWCFGRSGQLVQRRKL
jgi:hypothetical protein